jgi:N6-adenosine-specific RNA methylase IME4
MNPGFYPLATKQRAELLAVAAQLGPFDVLLCDFPWQFQAFSKKGLSRAAEVHYATMTLDEIEKYPLAAFAAPDSVLVSWATVPLLDKAINAMHAQGFVYTTGAVWDKTTPAYGFWLRNQHEILLLGKRGRPKAPPPADRPPSVIRERRTAHSRKPVAAYEMIERMFPERRKLELFARPPGRPGWWSIGLDTTAEAAAFRDELQSMNQLAVGARTIDSREPAPKGGNRDV